MGPPLVLLLLFGAAIHGVLTKPASYAPADTEVYKQEHCLQMSPQKEEEVNSIVAKLSDYLYNLTLEYEDIDIRLVKIIVESHSEFETEEKEMQVQLVVNDCAYTDEIIEKDGRAKIVSETNETTIDQSEEQQTNSETKSETSESKTEITDSSKSVNDESKSETVETATESAETDRNTVKNEDLKESVLIVDLAEDAAIIKPSGEDGRVEYFGKTPEVMLLDLDDTGNELVDLYRAKRGNAPLLIYVMKIWDTIQYLFLN